MFIREWLSLHYIIGLCKAGNTGCWCVCVCEVKCARMLLSGEGFSSLQLWVYLVECVFYLETEAQKQEIWAVSESSKNSHFHFGFSLCSISSVSFVWNMIHFHLFVYCKPSILMQKLEVGISRFWTTASIYEMQKCCMKVFNKAEITRIYYYFLSLLQECQYVASNGKRLFLKSCCMDYFDAFFLWWHANFREE